VAIAALAGAGISYLIIKNSLNISNSYASEPAISTTGLAEKCEFNIERMSGFEHIKPLLFAEMSCESPALEGIKQNIISLVDAAKASGKLVSASVYLKIYGKGEWTSYNADERYHPASLSKVAVLITYMRMAEKEPRLPDKRYVFNKHDNTLPAQYYTSVLLPPGHSYSVKELLRYMIAYSDNDATTLLWNHMDFEEYNNTFISLGLPKPSYKFEDLQLSAKEYSTFFRVLYNGSYLSNAASEFCFSLLIQSDFKEGLLKALPPSVVVAHKFGECTYGVIRKPGEKPFETLNELHEAGIVYNGKNPYLITIMTKGADRKYLTEIVGNISSLVYNALSKPEQAKKEALSLQ
jgi:beta-lactamase class A